MDKSYYKPRKTKYFTGLKNWFSINEAEGLAKKFMKIFFIMTPAFNPNAGGVQRTTYKLGKYFTEQGLSVTYYSLDNTGHVAVDYGEVYHAPQPGQCKQTANIRDMQRVLEKVRPDIVINQMPYEAELREGLYTSKQKLGYQLLACLRNSLFSVKNNVADTFRRTVPKPFSMVFDNPIGHRLFLETHKVRHRSYLKSILDIHDYFILLAPPNREEIQYFIGDYKAEKVTAIPNSIPFVDNSPVNKEKIILHVGRLNIPQKRSDLLLPFWDKLHRRLPDWEFVIVGDGPYKASMEKEIAQKNLPRVQLAGFQAPESYYQKASVFMMPAAFEGFPNVILEAQSYGVVPVAFESYSALRWIVNDIQDALLIPPFDTQAMSDAVAHLANDTKLLAAMQVQAKVNAGRFTIDKVGQQWLDFFESILK
jgi:glycosyltransferase involved in cell wall biosynthesis